MSDVQRFDITDSRGVRWAVIVSGPSGIGSGQPARELIWLARYRRVRGDGEITIDLYAADVDAEELRHRLEREPEWQHADWVQP